jgi:hypothetical protein
MIDSKAVSEYLYGSLKISLGFTLIQLGIIYSEQVLIITDALTQPILLGFLGSDDFICELGGKQVSQSDSPSTLFQND